jgi:hypothetical protein
MAAEALQVKVAYEFFLRDSCADCYAFPVGYSGGHHMADEDAPSVLGKLGSPEAKPAPKIPTIQTVDAKTKAEKPVVTIPPSPESAEFWKGYEAGYKDANTGKKPRAH